MTILAEARQALIIPELKASGRKELLRELTTAVVARFPQLNQDQLSAALEAREELGSTGIGDGAAIPHARISGVEQSILVLGRSSKGVTYNARDSRPVHLFLLLLTPTTSSTPYLSHLAELARFFRDPQTRSRLLQAESREEIQEILQP